MMTWNDIIDKILIGGIGLWALKGFIMERTRKRRFGDQYVTYEEMNVFYCQKEGRIKQSLDTERVHAVELLEKDLAHGRDRFKRIENTLEIHQQMLADLTGTTQKIYEAITRNGSSGGR